MSDDGEFPDISEIDALKADIEELRLRVQAARQATGQLREQFRRLTHEKGEEWLEKLVGHEEHVHQKVEQARAQLREAENEAAALVGFREYVNGDTTVYQPRFVEDPSRPLIFVPEGEALSLENAGTGWLR